MTPMIHGTNRVESSSESGKSFLSAMLRYKACFAGGRVSRRLSSRWSWGCAKPDQKFVVCRNNDGRAHSIQFLEQIQQPDGNLIVDISWSAHLRVTTAADRSPLGQ